MNFNELVKSIKKNKSMDDDEIQRFTEICEKCKQSMKAFDLSVEFSNVPSFILLEMSLEYAELEYIPEIISKAELLIDPDERKEIITKAISTYDEAVSPIIDLLHCGKDVPDYGIGRIVKFYNEAPEDCNCKNLAIEKIVRVCKVLFKKPNECTEARLEKIAKLYIEDPKIASVKATAEKMLADGNFV